MTEPLDLAALRSRADIAELRGLLAALEADHAAWADVAVAFTRAVGGTPHDAGLRFFSGIPDLLDRIESLRVAINGFRWVGNNLHNAGTDAFDGYFRAALEDARRAMGDDWEPMKLPRKAVTEPAEREAAR